MKIIFPHEHERKATLNEFLEELQRFKRSCRVPSNQELVKAAPKIKAKHQGTIELCHLSPATLSETFARKRRNPPRWDWVATFVLACLHIAKRYGVEPDFAGPTTLQEWSKRYQQMLERYAGTPPTARTDLNTGPDGTAASTAEEAGAQAHSTDVLALAPAGRPAATAPPPPPRPPTAPSSSAPPDQIIRWQELHDAALADWMHRLRRQQSMAHRRYYKLLGQHGVDLLMAAEAPHRDPEAACRLGLLLLCHDHPNEGMAWLRTAAEAGDTPAQVLINAAPSRLLEMAAELAYEVTLPGYTQDHGTSPTYAEVYYRAAAAAGHAGAGVRLGLILEARGEPITALHTYARAADRCHPNGIRHFQRLNNQLAQESSQHPSHEDPRPPTRDSAQSDLSRGRRGE